MGSGQRKKKSHKKGKGPYQKKKNHSLTRFEKFKERFSLQGIKTFFIGFKKTIITSQKKLDVQTFFHKLNKKTITYFKSNKQGVVFGVSLFAIVLIGYFAIVYEPQDKREDAKSTEVISIDLSEKNEMTTFMDNVENEISQIQSFDNTKLAASDDNITEIIESDVLEEQSDDGLVEIPVVEPVKIASADMITQINTTEKNSQNSNEQTYKSVEDTMMLGVDAYAIFVNDDPIAFFQTEGEAYMVIKYLQDYYSDSAALEEEIIFKEDIQIKKVKRNILDFDGYPSKDDVLELIQKGTNEQRIHVVESGENFWVIAEHYGLDPKELQDANSGIEERRLQIGTELSLVVARPIINVVTISTVERIDPIPFGKEDNIKTDDYFVGVYKIKRAGVEGQARNEVLVYKENGTEIGEKVLSTEVIEKPINQIAYEGTKPTPRKQGSGTLSKPTSRGYITSGFGNRSLGYHTGIDIGIPTGTEVKAADGGTVIFSAYKGTYGKLVMIDHGANRVTYYAHNSKLLVSSGTKVYKGEVIALSGSTGRSTGPHLHFEVRENGVPVNPKKYITY